MAGKEDCEEQEEEEDEQRRIMMMPPRRYHGAPSTNVLAEDVNHHESGGNKEEQGREQPRQGEQADNSFLPFDCLLDSDLCRTNTARPRTRRHLFMIEATSNIMRKTIDEFTTLSVKQRNHILELMHGVVADDKDNGKRPYKMGKERRNQPFDDDAPTTAASWWSLFDESSSSLLEVRQSPQSEKEGTPRLWSSSSLDRSSRRELHNAICSSSSVSWEEEDSSKKFKVHDYYENDGTILSSRHHQIEQLLMIQDGNDLPAPARSIKTEPDAPVTAGGRKQRRTIKGQGDIEKGESRSPSSQQHQEDEVAASMGGEGGTYADQGSATNYLYDDDDNGGDDVKSSGGGYDQHDEDMNSIGHMPLMIDSTFLWGKLQELDQAIDQIQHKDAYNQAQQAHNGYIANPKFRLVFLRAESFNARKAADRLVAFMDEKLLRFGPRALSRQLTIDDMSKASKSLLIKKGLMQVLPTRDSAGRAILVTYYNCSSMQDEIIRQATCLVSIVMLSTSRDPII